MAQKQQLQLQLRKRKRRILVNKNYRRKFAPLFDHGSCPDHCNGFRKITDEYDWPNRCFGHFR